MWTTRDRCGAKLLGAAEYGKPSLVVTTRIMVMAVVMYRLVVTLPGLFITITSGHKKLE